MEDLADLLASVVEFLVGGLLFTAALVFLFTSADPDLLNTGEAKWFDPGSTIAAVGFVALAYAVGIVAESLSRSIFEPILDRATLRETRFCAVEPTIRASESDSQLAKPIKTTLWLFAVWDPKLEQKLEEKPDEKLEEKLARRADIADSVIRERDVQRVRIMKNEALHGEVQGQLKRLRLERVFALSLALTVVALGVRHEWWWMGVAAVSTFLLVALVKSRCRRYCGAIARSYEVFTSEAKEPQADGTSSPATASNA